MFPTDIPFIPKSSNHPVPNPLPLNFPKTKLDKYSNILKFSDSFLSPSVCKTKRSDPSLESLSKIPSKLNDQLNSLKSTKTSKPFLTTLNFEKKPFMVTTQALTDRGPNKPKDQNSNSYSTIKEKDEFYRSTVLNADLWNKYNLKINMIEPHKSPPPTP